jgi:vacuolar iron transporter family protein
MSATKLSAIQTEIDASFLYALLAEHEADENVAVIFREMSKIEMSHAHAFMSANKIPSDQLPGPSVRARTLKWIGKMIGYEYVLGVLLETEKSLSASVIQARKKENLDNSISDTAHVSILRNILNNSTRVSGSSLARFEKRHRSVGGNALRAAVLGGNDGLVSNFSLMMGVAGAAESQQPVLLAGLAGLLAGALSMALGEWISVKSSQELYENQMQLEMDELNTNPEGEEKEIALIYMAKGIPQEQSKTMAAEIMKNKEKAHEILVKEELGINHEELKGSAIEAAVASFVLFAVGAMIPLVPFFFTAGYTAIILSTIGSAIGLFIIGSMITLFTGKSIWFSGFRQVGFGLAAAAVTFGVGHLIGVSVAG